MAFKNLYYCGVHKAASTFFRLLFDGSNKILAKYLKEYRCLHYETELKKTGFQHYQKQSLIDFPGSALIHSIHCDYRSFNAIKKYDDYMGFYLYRDPRELIVSFYYSWKESHVGFGAHPNRNILRSMGLEDGMIWTINNLLNTHGLFDAMVDWVENCMDERFWIVKFEDFFENDESQAHHLRMLLDWFKLDVAEDDYRALRDRLLFQTLSGGRKRGDQDTTHHYRSGSIDSWKVMLPPTALDYFYEKAGHVLAPLGYVDHRPVAPEEPDKSKKRKYKKRRKKAEALTSVESEVRTAGYTCNNCGEFTQGDTEACPECDSTDLIFSS